MGRRGLMNWLNLFYPDHVCLLSNTCTYTNVLGRQRFISYHPRNCRSYIFDVRQFFNAFHLPNTAGGSTSNVTVDLVFAETSRPFGFDHRWEDVVNAILGCDCLSKRFRSMNCSSFSNRGRLDQPIN